MSFAAFLMMVVQMSFLTLLLLKGVFPLPNKRSYLSLLILLPPLSLSRMARSRVRQGPPPPHLLPRVRLAVLPCRLPMPFKSFALIRLRAWDQQPRVLSLTMVIVALVDLVFLSIRWHLVRTSSPSSPSSSTSNAP